MRKAQSLRDEAKKLENKSDVESQSKRYELLEQANQVEKDAASKINPFEAVVDSMEQMMGLKSKKYNESKCRELSKKHQDKYGGEYVEVELTNPDGTKVVHAIVVHDGYVYEPQSDAIIDTDIFNEFFDANIGNQQTETKTFEQRKAEIEKITDPEQRKVAEIEFIMSNLASGVGEAAANKIR